MPVIGLDVVLTGHTTQQVTKKDENNILNFLIQEYLGDREQQEFSLEVTHPSNNKYLSNKTDNINVSMRSTKAVLTGTINWISADSSESSGKHVLDLEDISIFTTFNNQDTSQSGTNPPWLNNPGSTSTRNTRAARGAAARGVATRTSKRLHKTLNQMPATTIKDALKANPPPNMTDKQSHHQENIEDEDN
jgi:hypothetical protein